MAHFSPSRRRLRYTRGVPIARLAQETLRVTVLALVGFAVLHWLARRWDIPGLRAALGASEGT